jgi:hypothetical protein
MKSATMIMINDATTALVVDLLSPKAPPFVERPV